LVFGFAYIHHTQEYSHKRGIEIPESDSLIESGN